VFYFIILYIAPIDSVVDGRHMSKKCWWKDSDRENLKHPEETLSQWPLSSPPILNWLAWDWRKPLL